MRRSAAWLVTAALVLAGLGGRVAGTFVLLETLEGLQPSDQGREEKTR